MDLKTYIKHLEKLLKSGNATELTYRVALVNLLDGAKPGLTAANDPKHVDCGAPDVHVSLRGTTLGHVETKDLDEDLDTVEASEQLQRYLPALSNLVLTDFLEFRWYVNGERRLTARLAKLTHGQLKVDVKGVTEVEALLQAFLDADVPTIKDPEDLARRMAALTRMLRLSITKVLDADEPGTGLWTQVDGFRKVLLPDLDAIRFADMFAQTIAYGLFAARCNHPGKEAFTRQSAGYDLPRTNPFLKEVFASIAGPMLDERITWAVDDLAELLHRTDRDEVLRAFGRHTQGEDPVVHFYETFLAAYDPALRQSRGVYFTPEPVVSFIVASIDKLLRKDFKLAKGLADASKSKLTVDGATEEVHRVQILDPAAGTGTFLHAVISQVQKEFRGSPGLWSAYVRDQLLPRLFGFELLMAPYAVAHLKLGLKLQETKYDFKGDSRLRLFMTNTLELGHHTAGLPGFTKALAAEASAAADVKQHAPVMVVLGNPPYSADSANHGDWMRQLLRGHDTLTDTPTENYFQADGAPLGERNPRWLNDDYVKFIRFAQWRIARTGHGILGFITNNGYLNNPTFRGMRQSLLQTFDDLYLLDLHGGVGRAGAAHKGDENVFDIQQGVAIGIFVKRAGRGPKRPSVVRHAELWGDREAKYHWLWDHDVVSAKWKTIKPVSPQYAFTPQDAGLRDEYQLGWSLPAIMPVTSVGIVTARDALTVHLRKDDAWKAVTGFAALSPKEAREKFDLGPDSRDWRVELAQQDLKSSGPSKAKLQPILYRPFDLRWTYYTGRSRGFQCMPRDAVMRHLVGGENFGLVSARSNKSEVQDQFFCTRHITEAKCGESTTQSCVFPLYLTGAELELPGLSEGRACNLSPAFLEALATATGLKFAGEGTGDRRKTFGAEDVLGYAYAVFHSPTYRTRYAEFLKSDYPHLPLIRTPALFAKLSTLGLELVALHTGGVAGAKPPEFPISGSDTVDKVRYEAPTGDQKLARVWINETQYFGGVPEAAWTFSVGGHRPCDKWLKDRKGVKLKYEDLEAYRSLVAAINSTTKLTEGIDQVIGSHGGWPLV